MIIYPAIDLLDGQCVRLRQGQYDDVTVYESDPMRMAEKFKQAGATWLHVVDLNAAKTGEPYHFDIIARIRRQTGLKIQTGGGIRKMTHLDLLMANGIDRAVLGTAAVKNEAFTSEALAKYGNRIAIGVDADKGEVKVDGWTAGSGLQAFAFAEKMARMGAKTIIYTDISRDGMLTGTATDDIKELVKINQLDIIASGGIGSEADIEAVRKTGAAGVIVGKAIYEGKVRISTCWQKE